MLYRCDLVVINAWYSMISKQQLDYKRGCSMKKKSTMLWLSISVLVLLLVVHNGKGIDRLFQYLPASDDIAVAEESDMSKVVFVVHCYDEGSDALKGMKGILKVERGFRNFREINTVYYDPKVITIEEMEKALKSAGTYKETIRE
jgi:copper chaperone CopZ